MVTAGLRGVAKAIAENRDLLRNRIHAESPWWVPGSLDDVVFEKIYVSLMEFIADVAEDPNHEIRRMLDERARDWVTS